MSQVASTAVSSQIRRHWIVGVSALLALMATVAVVLVLAIDGGSSDSVAQKALPALRGDGGPDESSVAAAIDRTAQPATRSDGGPEESAVAGAIGGR